MKGYKAFNKDLTCRGFQYEIGKEYKHEGKIELCGAGFHFCKELPDCFNHYSGNSVTTRLCEIEVLGDVIHGDGKSVTSHIRIVKELSWFDVLKLANVGKYNTGVRNSGNNNSGNNNSGHYNSGSNNSGYYNSGNNNSGNNNSGHCNSGYYNSGNNNRGNNNSGNNNSGHYNSGSNNSGYYNSGCYNSGDSNSGLFNTDEPNARMFNKPTKKKMSEIDVPNIYLPVTEWISESAMTDEQKKADPQFSVKGGTLIKRTYKEAWQVAWERAGVNLRKSFLNLPNFCPKIFEEITGIEVVVPKKRKDK